MDQNCLNRRKLSCQIASNISLTPNFEMYKRVDFQAAAIEFDYHSHGRVPFDRFRWVEEARSIPTKNHWIHKNNKHTCEHQQWNLSKKPLLFGICNFESFKLEWKKLKCNFFEKMVGWNSISRLDSNFWEQQTFSESTTIKFIKQ